MLYQDEYRLAKVCTHGNFYCAASLGHQATGTYPTQSHYPVNELPGPCASLSMSSARLESDKYQLCKSLEIKCIGLSHWETMALAFGAHKGRRAIRDSFIVQPH